MKRMFDGNIEEMALHLMDLLWLHLIITNEMTEIMLMQMDEAVLVEQKLAGLDQVEMKLLQALAQKSEEMESDSLISEMMKTLPMEMAAAALALLKQAGNEAQSMSHLSVGV